MSRAATNVLRCAIATGIGIVTAADRVRKAQCAAERPAGDAPAMQAAPDQRATRAGGPIMPPLMAPTQPAWKEPVSY